MNNNLSKKVLKIIIIPLIVILIVDTYLLYKKTNNDIIEIPHDYNSVKFNFSISLLDNQSTLNCVYVYYDDSTKIFNLVDSIDEPTLIFRFSGRMCDQCVFFVIDKIKEKFENYSSNPRIVFLASEINPRAKTFYEKRIITLMKDLNGALEERQIPYLFITGKDHTKQFVFVPDKSCPKLTEEYLQTICTRFFQK